MTAIVARAITDGARPALAINAGVVTGDLLFFALAAAGMAAAAQLARRAVHRAAVARRGVPAVAGHRALALPAARPRRAGAGAAHESHFWRNYGAGLLLMFGHVQAMLFYAALLPGFVDLVAPDASATSPWSR